MQVGLDDILGDLHRHSAALKGVAVQPLYHGLHLFYLHGLEER